MPTIFVLVGLPASGKSTFYRTFMRDILPNAVYISSDEYIENVAIGMDVTYDEAFPKAVKEAGKYINSVARLAYRDKMDVIWDQTNMSAAKRRSILEKFPEYNKIAIVFKVDEEVRKESCANRPGKTIPDHVIESMKKSFEMPTKAEGFGIVIMESRNG